MIFTFRTKDGSLAGRFNIAIKNSEGQTITDTYIGEEITVEISQTDGENSFLNFYVQNCAVYILNKDVSYNLITGEDESSCPDSFTEVDFLQTTRVQGWLFHRFSKLKFSSFL